MSDHDRRANVSPYGAGIRARCPQCGKGPLFAGFLTLAPGCASCGLDYDFADSGDGPAVFVILIVGFVIVGAALVVEVAHQPPYWLHAAIWLPLAIGLCLGLVRLLKGVMVALQFQNGAREGRVFDE